MALAAAANPVAAGLTCGILAIEATEMKCLTSAVILLSLGAAPLWCADMITSSLAHQGPAFAPGMMPSTLGWGPDDKPYPDKFVVNPKDGAEMVWVPAGEFMMGSPEGEGYDDEHPQHKVMLSAYWMDKTDVTNEQYGKFLEWIRRTGDHTRCFKGTPLKDERLFAEPPNHDHTPSLWTDTKWNGPRQPVVGVDWWDAYAYAAWAAKRLPTEAEWEKASRGTDGRKYPWGSEWDPSKCNSKESGKGATVEVGIYAEDKSPYGCLDMGGNAHEWCADWYGGGAYYLSSPRENPAGPAISFSRVIRGGAWSFDHSCAYRDSFAPVLRINDIGFRCARTP